MCGKDANPKFYMIFGIVILNFMRILGFRKDACPSMPAGRFLADAAEVAVVFEDFVEFNKRGMIWEPGTEK